MSRQANISVYYKDFTNFLHKLVAVTTIDPEGVTEEDVQRARTAAQEHVKEQKIDINGPILIAVKGGKA